MPSVSQGDSQIFSLILRLKHLSRPSTYTVVTTKYSKTPTLDELFSVVLTHAETWIMAKELLQLICLGADYLVIWASEARAIESLNHWRDRCQVLDTFLAVSHRILFQLEEQAKPPPIHPAAATETRSVLATTWGFSESNILYTLYMVLQVSCYI